MRRLFRWRLRILEPQLDVLAQAIDDDARASFAGVIVGQQTQVPSMRQLLEFFL